MTLQEALQEIEKLREENKILKEKIEKLNKALEDNDEWNANVIKNLKDEMKELKQRVENLENTVDYDDGIVYPESETENEAEWFDLKTDGDYEIKNIYPYDIRKKSNGRVVIEFANKKYGYVQLSLNGKSYQKHIIVAKHFINYDDPNNKKIVDHIDHDRSNYNTKNLRWISTSDNNKNRSSHKGIVYEYVDTIPDDAMKVDTYGKHTFDNYYFYDNIFYFYTGINYRKLHINEDKNGFKYVNLLNDNGKNIVVSYSKFKKEHDIPIE